MTGGEVVTVSSPSAPASYDAYGEPVAGAPTTTEVRVLNIAPGSSSEDNEGQSTVRDTLTVYMPPSAVVGADDTVTVRGTVYQVSGTPQDWRNRAGRRVGVVVELVAAS